MDDKRLRDLLAFSGAISPIDPYGIRTGGPQGLLKAILAQQQQAPPSQTPQMGGVNVPNFGTEQMERIPPYTNPTYPLPPEKQGILSKLAGLATNPQVLGTIGALALGGPRAGGAFANTTMQQQQIDEQNKIRRATVMAQIEESRQRAELERQRVADQARAHSDEQVRRLATDIQNTGVAAPELAQLYGVTDPAKIQAASDFAARLREAAEKNIVYVDTSTGKQVTRPDANSLGIVSMPQSEYAKFKLGQLGKEERYSWWIGPENRLINDRNMPEELKKDPRFLGPLSENAVFQKLAPHAESVEQQSMKDWLAKNPGKGPSDYRKWEANLRPASSQYQGASTDAQDIADDIMKGLQPPSMRGLYRLGGPVRAALARSDFDIVKAETEWNAVQKWVAGANSTQQLRMRQAVEKIEPHVEVIEDLYAKLQAKGLPSGYKVWNKGALAVAKNLPGETGALAQALETQIVDLSAELGNVYMGGNTPTDHALQQAAQNLSADWNPETFKKATELIRKNVSLRRNAIRFTGPAGVPTTSPYYPQDTVAPGAGATPAPPAQNPPSMTLPNGTVVKLQPDGTYK